MALVALAVAMSWYLAASLGSPSAASSAPSLANPSSDGGASSMYNLREQGQVRNRAGSHQSRVRLTIGTRPPATLLPSGPSLAGMTMQRLSSGLQADFNELLRGDTMMLRFDGATDGPALTAFMESQAIRLQTVSIIPTVVSATLGADGSQTVGFTAVVNVLNGVWPTNYGTLSATLFPDGSLLLPHATACTLVSPLATPCPF